MKKTYSTPTVITVKTVWKTACLDAGSQIESGGVGGVGDEAEVRAMEDFKAAGSDELW